MSHGIDLTAAAAALCASGDPVALAAILLTLLGAGFFGGFAHCGPMCGPFVLMQVGESGAGEPVLRRLGGALLPGYQLGRIVTYSLLGALAGGAGGLLTNLTGMRVLLAALMGIAACLFLLQALKGFAFGLKLAPASGGSRWGQALAGVAGALFRSSLRPRGFALGLVLGLLPCGFLYSALAAAAAIGTAPGGALAMAVFGIGTMPTLAAVALFGTALATRWRHIAASARPLIFLVNAMVLGGIALRLAT